MNSIKHLSAGILVMIAIILLTTGIGTATTVFWGNSTLYLLALLVVPLAYLLVKLAEYLTKDLPYNLKS